MKKVFLPLFIVIMSLIFFVSLIIFPKTALTFAERGLLICAEIVIPSLFPIYFCTVFIMKLINRLNFKINRNLIIFVFSLLGGYPTGAKLIEEEYKSLNIEKNTAHLVQTFSVNAGVGFIVSAVGYNIFGSKKIGLFLFLSHFLSSFILFLIFYKKTKNNYYGETKKENLADLFVISASEASNTILSVCSFVILFSVINGFLLQCGQLKFLCFFTEITGAVFLTKNIYFVSFLLSFGGISVWCQIISVSKTVGINLKIFLLSRVICGSLSALFMYVFVNLFKLPLSVLSNNISFSYQILGNKISISISLLILVILFIISIEGKKIGGNLSDDLLK